MAQKNIKLIYDTCAMLTKQAEQQAAEGKEPDKAILDALASAFTDILEFEKLYLIQAQDRFYGNVLMDIDLSIDFTQRGAVDLKIDRSPIMLGVNPLFCSQYKFPEFTGLIISEILKMVYMHPTAFGKLNSFNDESVHENLNLASDAATNSIVKHDIRLTNERRSSYGYGRDSSEGNGCRLPHDAYTASTINEDCKVSTKEEMPLEYYFQILQKFKKKKEAGEGPQIQISGTGNGVATQNNSTGKPIHNWENQDPDEVEEQLKSIISEAYNNLDEQQRGNMPSTVQSQIKKLLAPPEISWKDVLRKMVGSVPVPHRNTRRKLNRRQPERADLPGRLPKRVVNIVVAFDTSGSMSDEDLRYCMNEVFNIVKVYEGYKITVIECDATVQRVYTAHKMEDLKLDMRGRGGTSFIPVIEYINGEGEYKNSKKFPNAGKYKDALLVYFTDGYGDYEIPRPRTYRNLWVVLQDESCLSLKNPYGDVKCLKKDKDWQKMKGR